MTRRTTSRALPSAGLIGVVAAVAVIVIGWIAYNANVGVPWERRTEITVEVPNANRLIRGADVRIGGVAAGTVSAITAERDAATRRSYARITLNLRSDARDVPVDSTVQVRPASVLGLTYVDLHLGRSAELLADGDTLPLKRARASSDLTDLFDIFDRGTARGIQDSISGLAYGLAGRGSSLNSSIGSISQLLPRLGDVSETLADPSTRLDPFLRAAARTTGRLDNVRQPLGDVMSAGAVTFGALLRPGSALGASIAAAPPAERAATTALIRVRPALDDVAALAVAVRPATRRLRRTAGRIDVTLRAGVPALREVSRAVPALRTALTAVRRFAGDTAVSRSLVKLADLVTPTREVMDVLGPAQTACNMLSLWGQAVFNVLAGAGTGQGPALANIVFSALGADGEVMQNPGPSPDVGINAIPTQNASECEANNEVWDATGQVVNPPGLQSRQTRDTTPPPGVAERARAAGLLNPGEGAP